MALVLKCLEAAEGRLAMGRIGEAMDLERRLEERRRFRASEDAIRASLMMTMRRTEKELFCFLQGRLSWRAS